MQEYSLLNSGKHGRQRQFLIRSESTASPSLGERGIDIQHSLSVRHWVCKIRLALCWLRVQVDSTIMPIRSAIDIIES